MRVSAKADYAVRAAVELVNGDGTPMKADQIAEAQDIPIKFLEKILHELRRAGIITSVRGPEGGHRLLRKPEEVSVADILRAVEGRLADVRGMPPEQVDYHGASEALQHVWIALRTNIRSVLETVTISEIAGDDLPKRIEKLANEPESWITR